MEKLPEKRNETLADRVEEILIDYFKENNLTVGSHIPNEVELAKSLGVGRPIIREALSRFKMTGMIISRPKVGMVLAEPSLFGGMKNCINPLLMTETTMQNIMELRIAIEIGISDAIFDNIKAEDIEELEEIVELSEILGNNIYAPINEHQFHTKLYEITGNNLITEFQSIIYPVLDFVKEKDKEYLKPIGDELAANNEQVTHEDLLEYIKNNDRIGYKKAIEGHFKTYTIYLRKYKKKS